MFVHCVHVFHEICGKDPQCWACSPKMLAAFFCFDFETSDPLHVKFWQNCMLRILVHMKCRWTAITQWPWLILWWFLLRCGKPIHHNRDCEAKLNIYPSNHWSDRFSENWSTAGRCCGTSLGELSIWSEAAPCQRYCTSNCVSGHGSTTWRRRGLLSTYSMFSVAHVVD